ncbi:hypothetical protein GCM10027071_21440 [Microbacterium marinum]
MPVVAREDELVLRVARRVAADGGRSERGRDEPGDDDAADHEAEDAGDGGAARGRRGATDAAVLQSFRWCSVCSV